LGELLSGHTCSVAATGAGNPTARNETTETSKTTQSRETTQGPKRLISSWAERPAAAANSKGSQSVSSGTIKSLIPAKGFGFISSDGKPNADLFFHSSAVVTGQFDSLQVGQAVTFEEEADSRDPSRLRAKNVRLTGGGLYS
jgi:CspA family cold shock protein